jgi:hypothetical protein
MLTKNGYRGDGGAIKHDWVAYQERFYDPILSHRMVSSIYYMHGKKHSLLRTEPSRASVFSVLQGV